MDSDYELVDSDGDFVDQGASSDESLVALSGDSEDDLVQNSRILARKKGSHILSPHQTSTRNSTSSDCVDETSSKRVRMPNKPSDRCFCSNCDFSPSMCQFQSQKASTL